METMLRRLSAALLLVSALTPLCRAQRVRAVPVNSGATGARGTMIAAPLGGSFSSFRGGAPSLGGLTSVLPSAPGLRPAAGSRAASAETSLSPSILPAAAGSEASEKPSAKAPRSVEAEVGVLSGDFSRLSEDAPAASEAPGESDHSFGRRTEDLILGSRAILPNGVLGTDDQAQWGKPAGDSISKAARAEFGEAPPAGVPAPPVPPSGPAGSPTSSGASAVFLKLLASAISLAPAALALPAVLTGPIWAPIMMGAAAGLLAVSPWFPAATPRFIRDLPGLALLLLGAAAFLTGVSLLIGPVAMLGGWGLSRLALKASAFPVWYTPGSRPILSSFVAASTAVAALGLALGGVFGTLPWAMSLLSGVFSVFLLIHLPLPMIGAAGNVTAKLFLAAAWLAGLGRLAIWLALSPVRRLRGR